jgi:hypothetical protein
MNVTEQMKTKRKCSMNAEKKRELRRKITAGIKAAVAFALEDHRRSGRRVAIWQDGRVCIVTPEIPLQQEAMVLRDKPTEKAVNP